MVERQYEVLRRERLRGSEENRSDGPASNESTPNSTPTPTPASLNDEPPSEVSFNVSYILVISTLNFLFIYLIGY